ncbi:MAG: hypothetical protein QM796_13610 [Chthoniobacteraceae bacterium]
MQWLLFSLSWSLEFHDPNDHGFQISDHQFGIGLILFGIWCLFGRVTTSRGWDVTSWLRIESEERPLIGWQRLLAVAILLGWGVYLLKQG